VKACGATRHTLHDDDRRLDIDLDLVDLHDQRDIDLRDLQLHDNVHGRRLDIVHVELHFHVRLVLDPGSHLDLHVLVDPGRHLDPHLVVAARAVDDVHDGPVRSVAGHRDHMMIKMLVAIVSVKLKTVGSLDEFVELDEPLYLLCFLWLMIVGAGRASLDSLSRGPTLDEPDRARGSVRSPRGAYDVTRIQSP
jgi:hypothetical protein